MGFKQKGFSSHTGTSGHRSALKAHIANHKPEMSKVSKHGQIGDAKADFKSDQEAYKKAMADKTKTKSMETLHEEGFSPNDALKMQKDGAATGEQDAPPTKFLGLGDKEGRAKRKTMRKEAKVKRQAAKKVTRSENKKIKSDAKTDKLASRLNKRQVKAETNVTEKKENKAKKGSKFKGNINDGVKKVNKFLYGDKGKAETGGTNAEMAKNDKSGKRAIRNYKVNKALHDINEGKNAVLKNSRMKEFDGEDPRNKLKGKQNQNTTLGTKTGNKSKSKTSKAAEFKKDSNNDTVEQNMAKTQAKIDKKKANTKAKATKKSLESNPLYKANKGVKKGGGSYDKYFG
jgi:hypothetical protein|tara:strand:- start:2456 stop:3487 length:1032 start_codon:yes stop_codon:yes gene_type:complete